MKQKKLRAGLLTGVGLAVVLFFVLFPYVWLILSSLKTSQEIFAVPMTIFPEKLTFEGYAYALFDRSGPDLFPYLRNSLVVGAATAVLTILFAATGGYAIGRRHFKGMRAVVVFIMLAQMFQGPVIMVPWYKMAGNMKVLNTLHGLVMIYLTGTIPISLWLMSGFFKGIPYEMEEAAMIDGCDPLRTFWQVVLPMAKNGMVSITIYAFILAWNDYQYALILTNSKRAQTVQLTIGQLMDSLGIINWGGIMACGVIVSVPVIILFACIQRYLIEGLTAGAVKG